MSPGPQALADAASDAYNDRPQSDVDSKTKAVYLDHQKYTIFGYKGDPATGFHATAYKEVAPPHNIIIAYRGTDPDIKGHTRTTFQDATVDATMVKAQINPQEAAARAFTREMLDKAHDSGISRDHVTVAGHSLGGTLAEIEAWEFGLHGATFNAYGAAGLIYGVPEGGHQITNYVIAGDVVSAASHHFGEMKELASPEDVAALQAGRYLNAPPGAPSPNPLLAMRLSDHSMANFTGEGGVVNVLAPANMAEYQTRYDSHRVTFDLFRSNIHDERTELAAVLNDPDSRNIETTLANLPPHIQQQLLELHVAMVDAPIQSAVEHNRVVQGVEQGLDQTAATIRWGGQGAQHDAELLAQKIHAAGLAAQQQADAVSREAQVFMPIDPMAATGTWLGAKAAGYVMHAEADGVAGVSRLAGQAAHVGSQWMADQTQETRHTVAQGAHVMAQLATTSVHAHEAFLVTATDRITDTYQAAKAAGQALRRDVTQACDATRHAVSQAVDATEHAVDQAGDAFMHQAQRWFGHAPAPSATAPTHSAIAPTGSGHGTDDPRHPDNPDHPLYNELHRRIPEASDNRLIQFTTACHAHKITADNLSTIYLDEANMTLGFRGSSMLSTPVVVDLKTPTPPPQQAIQHIQQFDQQQAQMMAHFQGQHAQMNQQGLQGPAQGGP